MTKPPWRALISVIGAAAVAARLVHPALGGYQMGVAMDIFRGRYRLGFDRPAPIPSNTPQLYCWSLCDAAARVVNAGPC
jgi:hypothetical protein